MIKECPICKNTFETDRESRIYCGNKCKAINSSRNYYARKKGTIAPAEPRRKKRKKVNQDLIDFAREAREHGMTYGQYAAYVEGGAR